MRFCAITIFALALSPLPAFAAAQDDIKDYSGSYMCRPIGTAGIGFDKQAEKWRAATFETSDIQHFIKFTALDDQTAGKLHEPNYRTYQVSLNRADLPGLEATKCGNEVVPEQQPGTVVMFTDHVSCKAQDGTFTFNFDNMRFQRVSDYGYLLDTPIKADYIQVGTCVRLD